LFCQQRSDIYIYIHIYIYIYIYNYVIVYIYYAYYPKMKSSYQHHRFIHWQIGGADFLPSTLLLPRRRSKYVATLRISCDDLYAQPRRAANAYLRRCVKFGFHHRLP
jgi:hypothetical protein